MGFRPSLDDPIAIGSIHPDSQAMGGLSKEFYTSIHWN